MKDLIRFITKISEDYDEKYMKIKLNSHDKLSLNKTIDITSMILVVRAVFHENTKYYPQVFLDECLNKLNIGKKQKYNLQNKKFLYFTCFFINHHCIIDSC